MLYLTILGSTLFALFALINCAPEGARFLASSVTTPRLIRQHGYPVEIHQVQTADGYILTMHRIPWSPKHGNDNRERPIAFLMHGLLCSSSDWVLLGPQRSLAYILSDAGYDVWMGNARGNVYSKKHATKNPIFQPFWNFSWHEIAIYDLPAMIDYILYLTQQNDLRYFGHSQGTTVFLVLNSMVPSFNRRIRSAHLLAPVGYMNHMESFLAKIGAPLLGHPNAFVELFGSTEFMPSSKLMELLGYAACVDSAPTQMLCKNVLFLICGWDSPFMNETLIPEVMATTPAGSSVNQIQHYLQEYNSGYFRNFDLGHLRNKREYGAKNPPSYNLKNVVAPIFTYFSDNDALASDIDVMRLHGELNRKTLKGKYELPSRWNHMDYLYGLNVEQHLYAKVMDDVNKS